MHQTAVERKIKFHDENASDPDWKVKLCYKLMIASTTENVKGASNLWKRGNKPNSRHPYPNYQKYMSHHEFIGLMTVQNVSCKNAFSDFHGNFNVKQD